MRGASHVRSGQVNQDFMLGLVDLGGQSPDPSKSSAGTDGLRDSTPSETIRLSPSEHRGERCVIAVSDGHGSKKCFRSHLGARLAVEVAIEELGYLLRDSEWETRPTELERCLMDRLADSLVLRWRSRVLEDVKQHPFSEPELQAHGDSYGEAAIRDVKNPLVAYGATLIAAVVTPLVQVYVQLGDGDLLIFGRNGEVSRPLEDDPMLFGNETTSLCMSDAQRFVRLRVMSDPEPPALILLSTDGYSNSFATEADFRQVAADLWATLSSQGIDSVSSYLNQWLNETSRSGSGDDITLGLIVRAAALDAESVPHSDQEVAQSFEVKAPSETDCELIRGIPSEAMVGGPTDGEDVAVSSLDGPSLLPCKHQVDHATASEELPTSATAMDEVEAEAGPDSAELAPREPAGQPPLHVDTNYRGDPLQDLPTCPAGPVEDSGSLHEHPLVSTMGTDPAQGDSLRSAEAKDPDASQSEEGSRE